MREPNLSLVEHEGRVYLGKNGKPALANAAQAVFLWAAFADFGYITRPESVKPGRWRIRVLAEPTNPVPKWYAIACRYPIATYAN